MISSNRIVLRRIVTNFTSANIILATEGQFGVFAKSDPDSPSETIAEIGRILHNLLLLEEQLVVRWERRVHAIFQWSPWRARNKQPDFAWLAERLKGRFERTQPRSMTVVGPSEILKRLRRTPCPPLDIRNEEEVFRALAITDAFLRWDEFDLHDDDGLDWIPLRSPDHHALAECPVRQPDVAIVSVFNETTAAIIIGNDQSRDQLRAIHDFLADRKIEYQIW